jgi:hypothetical protein
MADPAKPHKPSEPPERRSPSAPSDGTTKPSHRAGGRRQVDDTFEDLIDTFTTHLDEVKYIGFSTRNTYAKWARVYYRWLVTTDPLLVLTDASPATIRAFVAYKRNQTIKPSTIGTILRSLNRALPGSLWVTACPDGAVGGMIWPCATPSSTATCWVSSHHGR